MAKVRLTELRLDHQPKENICEPRVEHFRELLRRGEILPPVTVRFDRINYFLQDGFHRVEAALREGIKELEATIVPGGLEDIKKESREYNEAVWQSLR